mmetsp:Transcript_54860/g.138618  ORF Transcript_54860/g.138618 Transcript_54860/m.138618 type:complete len:202 (+) Transcript_54860:135-740(+)
MQPIVGPPVGVVQGTVVQDAPAAARFYEKWAYDSSDCFGDFSICCLTFCCMWPYSAYQQAALFPPRLKLDQAPLNLPAVGQLSGADFAKYAIVVFVVCLVVGGIGRSMTEEKQEEVMIEGQPRMMTFQVQTPIGGLLSSLAGLLDFFWAFLVYKGVAKRFSIQEDDATSCFKMFCCRPCTMTQVFRHVQDYDRVNQGQLPQ